jgi:uncharacterized protein YbbK (DUF523 family)
MKEWTMNQTDDRVILVSACLLEIACRYNGASRKNDKVLAWLSGKRFVPVCPESLSGLPIPRDPAEYDNGDGTMVRSGKARILLRNGDDVTRDFIRGSVESLKIARLVKANEAILKDRSPSCGVYRVYNRGELVQGVGCFTALLLLEGVAVRSEKDVEKMMEDGRE